MHARLKIVAIHAYMQPDQVEDTHVYNAVVTCDRSKEGGGKEAVKVSYTHKLHFYDNLIYSHSRSYDNYSITMQYVISLSHYIVLIVACP